MARNESDFRLELAAVLNRHSAENGSNTPDLILAMFLTGCLEAFDSAVQQRETWYGRDPRVGPGGMRTETASAPPATAGANGATDKCRTVLEDLHDGHVAWAADLDERDHDRADAHRLAAAAIRSVLRGRG